MPNASLLRFLGYMRPHLRKSIEATAAGVVKFVLPFAFPLAFKYIIDVLLAPQPRWDRLNMLMDGSCRWIGLTLGLGDSAQAKWEALTLALIVIYVLQAVASYYRDYCGLTAGCGLIYDLRSALFTHLQRLPHSFFDRWQAGTIFSRLVNDVDLAQEFVFSALTNVWIDTASIALAAWLLVALDHRLALVALAVLPLYAAVIYYFAPRIKYSTHRLQETVAQFSGDLQERITGAATIKAFNRSEREIDRFNLQTRSMYDKTVDKIQLIAWQNGWTELLARVAPTAVVWVAAVFVARGATTLGTMVAFVGFIGYLYQPLERMSSLSIVVASALAAIERIFAFLDLKPGIESHPLSRPMNEVKGSIRFEKVCFAYTNSDGKASKPILQDIDGSIPCGATVALVGSSGAGKSTLANLVPRFYEPTAGRILIDGRNIRHYTLDSLRENIGIVTQETHLFTGSVRELMHYAKPHAAADEIWWALEQANLRKFIEQLPHGLDTVVGKGGINMSGGQRQRLALARVFLKNPPILILDEATSALDSESENLVYDAMRRLTKGRTSLLIAHRLQAAASADFVMVMNEGRVAEIGSHEALLALGGIYARLFGEQVRGLTSFYQAQTVTPQQAHS